MDPRALIPPENPLGYPTPFWFIQLLKVLGFSLHVAAMNIWYAGAPLAAVMGLLMRGEMQRLGQRIALALPFVLAFGINFGIIPLLFMQVAYYQFFYPATILIAWPWFAVFWLVIAGYTGAYLYRLSITGAGPVRLGRAGAWVAAGILLVVGFLFASGMSLMTNVDGWWRIFRGANVSGAATGAALNTADPTLVPRWLFMLGLAITTTAAYVAVDSAFLAGNESDRYRRRAARFSFYLCSVGIVWFAGVGSWYIFGTRPEAFPTALGDPVMRFIFPLTAVSPGLVWLILLFGRNAPSRRLAALAAVAQFGVIVLNAASRQWLQNVELAPYADLAARKVDLQLSALIVFLAVFVAGLALCAWLVWKMIEANRRSGPAAEGEAAA